MRIFALETNTEKFKRNFLAEGEREVLTVRYHGVRFFLSAAWMGVFSLILATIAVGIWYAGVPGWIVAVIASLLWLALVFPRLLTAYIDWRYDFAFVTTDKVVIVDQSSVFHLRITPINLENFASVSTETQFFNLFPFGKLRFHLKSGLGEDLALPYIANADGVAAQIANVVTEYQRRKDLRRHGEADGSR
ncbi:MAG: hypothetical protein PHW10_04670 [Candidatus Peribacteraceae bacterium]|nr:hypothetical protein [Candidatus Peribacteraceae bacterium]